MVNVDEKEDEREKKSEKMVTTGEFDVEMSARLADSGSNNLVGSPLCDYLVIGIGNIHPR